MRCADQRLFRTKSGNRRHFSSRRHDGDPLRLI
jgi:hypothetical protein